MIVKILKKSASFKAVRYNTGKVEKDRGELLLVQNFGLLQGLENLRPQDYINYLEAVSARSTRTIYPQFHVAISTKGKAHSREELAEIAQKWMQGMGYGEQPYLLIYHKDTANNHVHLVSTRVGRDGKKISDRYEKLRAYRVLNQVMGEDEKLSATKHLQKALSYSFSTRAQFLLILEVQGYTPVMKDGQYTISKNGRELANLDVTLVDERIKARERDKSRAGQIRAIILRYSSKHDPTLRPTQEGYTSDLVEFLREKFGMHFIFHGGADNKPPYGYSLIDHSGKAVYKGGEIMSLAEFITPRTSEETPHRYGENTAVKDDTVANENTIEPQSGIRQAPQPHSYSADDPGIPLPTIDINISDDIDDEAIHGRNRRRKRKSRTNTR